MELTEEEMILFDELFNLKARLQLPNNDENTKEKLKVYNVYLQINGFE